MPSIRVFALCPDFGFSSSGHRFPAPRGAEVASPGRGRMFSSWYDPRQSVDPFRACLDAFSSLHNWFLTAPRAAGGRRHQGTDFMMF